jgi:hypothetical protein
VNHALFRGKAEKPDDELTTREPAYRRQVLCALSRGGRYFSNYMLYNYTDGPYDLWKRLGVGFWIDVCFVLFYFFIIVIICFDVGGAAPFDGTPFDALRLLRVYDRTGEIGEGDAAPFDFAQDRRDR